MLYGLAYVQAIRHDWPAAREAYHAAERLFEGLGNRLEALSSRMGMGMVDTLRGEHREAVSHLRESIEGLRALGESFAVANSLQVMARALMHLGEHSEAPAATREALRISIEQRSPTGISAGLLDMATLDALAGEPSRAARLVGAADRIVERVGGQAPPELVNRIEPVPLIDDAIGPDERRRLAAEGAGMSDEEVAAYALAPDLPGVPPAP